MPVTPLHVAYVWPLKLKFRRLSFAALTIGSMVPDIENPILASLGFYSNRLVTQSLVGAVTIDLLLTVLVAMIVARIHLERFGVHGFQGLRIDSYFIFSALIGSLTHVAVDALHHENNPVFWPMSPTYLPSPLHVALGYLGANLVANVASLLVVLYLVNRILREKGEGLALFLTDPRRALSILTTRLNEHAPQ